MDSEQTFSLATIKNGTVIDHITAGQALKIIDILKLVNHSKKVSIGLNYNSDSMLCKDIIKVEDKELTPEEVNQIAILSPQATINIVENGSVVRKVPVEIPQMISGIVDCLNPNCITRTEPITPKFAVQKRAKATLLRCHHCKKQFTVDQMKSNERVLV